MILGYLFASEHGPSWPPFAHWADVCDGHVHQDVVWPARRGPGEHFLNEDRHGRSDIASIAKPSDRQGAPAAALRMGRV